jgi:acyl dehydratase
MKQPPGNFPTDVDLACRWRPEAVARHDFFSQLVEVRPSFGGAAGGGACFGPSPARRAFQARVGLLATEIVPMISQLRASELETLVGRPLEPSAWFLVDQARIDAFADATLDHQFIHVDRERAAKTPFGSTVAHGFLTLSLLSHLCKSSGFVVEGALMSVNYGLNRVRFVSPVTVGSEIRAVRTVKAIERRPAGQYLLTSDVTVEIKGKAKPAMIAEWLALIVVPHS